MRRTMPCRWSLRSRLCLFYGELTLRLRGRINFEWKLICTWEFEDSVTSSFPATNPQICEECSESHMESRMGKWSVVWVMQIAHHVTCASLACVAELWALSDRPLLPFNVCCIHRLAHEVLQSISKPACNGIPRLLNVFSILQERLTFAYKL